MKRILLAAGVAALFLATSIAAQQTLPADLAGPIPPATGQIAFARGGSVWTMDIFGGNQQLIADMGNADGRMCWSPDNANIIYTRSGVVDLQGPDLLGGKHKVYDLFIASRDTAANNNRMWWYRITSDLGSRDPQWTPDNKIVFWKDINANQVNSPSPNYQLATINPDGSGFELMRKDWQNFEDEFLISPSISKDGRLACVYFKGQKPVGLVSIPLKDVTMPMDSIAKLAEKGKGYVSPAWSPNGKWIACVNNSLKDGGLYLFSADMSQKYLVASPPAGTYLTGFAPSFSAESKWLTFSTTDGSIWVVDITGNGLRRVSGPGADKSPAWSN